MRKSARIIGKPLNLSGQETNILLEQQGFLTGVPGDYTPTEKGAAYVFEGYNHAGMRSWDDSIIDRLDLTPDAVKAARVEAARQRAARSDHQHSQKSPASETAHLETASRKSTSTLKSNGAALVSQAGIQAIHTAGDVLAPMVAAYVVDKVDDAVARRQVRGSQA